MKTNIPIAKVLGSAIELGNYRFSFDFNANNKRSNEKVLENSLDLIEQFFFSDSSDGFRSLVKYALLSDKKVTLFVKPMSTLNSAQKDDIIELFIDSWDTPSYRWRRWNGIQKAYTTVEAHWIGK